MPNPPSVADRRPRRPPPPPGAPTGDTDGAKAARPWYRKKRIMIPLGIVVLAAIGSGLEQPSDTDQVDAAVAAATPSDEPTTQEPASPEPSTQEATTPEPESEDAPRRGRGGVGVVALPDGGGHAGADQRGPRTRADARGARDDPRAGERGPAGRDYLDFAAFSRTGLIEQLESEGYTTEDATLAVDALTVDWNEQAAQKAEDYLGFTAFSRSGLIEQLEFEGFTREQAEYGVAQTGL